MKKTMKFKLIIISIRLRTNTLEAQIIKQERIKKIVAAQMTTVTVNLRSGLTKKVNSIILIQIRLNKALTGSMITNDWMSKFKLNRIRNKEIVWLVIVEIIRSISLL